MKKVIAVLLSAVLFCLASGTAFAAGCNQVIYCLFFKGFLRSA